ncbi:MAG TPA: erythromycin esterase family protein [Pseudonocardiaceae bacterium]
MPERLFRDRRDAGRILATLLDQYREQPGVMVLGLPRGGVPVAYEVAAALGAPLDVFLVRKLGVPGRPELAMGAIASGGVVVLNDDVVRGLGIAPDVIQRVVDREARELHRRERAYREDRPALDITGRTVILVDDGLATGASMRAAIVALRKLHPARIVVAVPAAPKSTCGELATEVDDVVCATTPTPFFAVGQSYWDFTQTTDDEVSDLLGAASRQARVVAGPGHTDAAAVRSAAIPVRDGVPADDVLFDLVGDARLVLIGEASHGTHEFYAARAAITRRLIEERGFERFPTWMWRNAAVLHFVGWLREHNDRAGEHSAKAGFYGLDLYGLHRSAHEVIAYLEQVDPAAAARARERYSCFDHADGDDGRADGYAIVAAFGAGESREQVILEQLVGLQRRALEYPQRDGLTDDEQFHTERSARTMMAAEQRAVGARRCARDIPVRRVRPP